MLGYEKDPKKGENIQPVHMTAADVAAIKQSTGATEFASYYTCSLKDMGSCNIAATRLGLPLWEVSSQIPMAKDLLDGTKLARDNISGAAQVVGELLKMVTNEKTMENGNVLIK